MKARGGRFLLILGAGLAAMAFVVVYLVMSKGSAATDNTASVPVQTIMKSIVVAKKNIPAYTTLDETNLGLLEVDASTVSADAVTDPSTLYKKMSTEPLTAQKPVLASQVTAVSFSNSLAKGEKAFSLSVPARSTFADSISENDRVDVLWTASINVTRATRSPDGKTVYEPGVFVSTKTLLQDIKVLRVVKLASTQPPPAAAGGADTPDSAPQKTAVAQPNLSSLYASKDAPYTTVLILALTDQQAEVLKYLRENGGEIDLTLRSSAAVLQADGTPAKDPAGKEIRGDREVEKTTGITLDYLIQTYGLTPPPAQLQAPTP